MANPRGTVTIGALELVADVGQYQPFSDAALAVRAFEGIEAVTIQDFGFRAARQQGTLSSGGGPSGTGLIAKATLVALLDLIRAWGVTQPLEDSLGNAGTIKAMGFTHQFEAHVPGTQGALFSYTLAFRWVTITSLYGAAYTEP